MQWKREGKSPEPEYGKELSLSADPFEGVRKAALARRERSVCQPGWFVATAHNRLVHALLAVSRRLPARGWLSGRAHRPPQGIPASPGARVSDRGHPDRSGNG